MKRTVPVLSLLLSAMAWGYPDGAPPAHTGGFNEPSCSGCHFAEAQSRQLAVIGLPEAYRPEQTYVLQLQLQLDVAEAAVAGFQLSVRFASSGEQAGVLQPASGQQIQPAEEVLYLTHNQVMAVSQGRVEWRLEWTAPAQAVTPVVWHVAAVAANHDESPLGDQVYLLTETLEASPGEPLNNSR